MQDSHSVWFNGQNQISCSSEDTRPGPQTSMGGGGVGGMGGSPARWVANYGENKSLQILVEIHALEPAVLSHLTFLTKIDIIVG